VIKTEIEIILKYKEFTIEKQPMWNVKIIVTPVVTGANLSQNHSERT